MSGSDKFDEDHKMQIGNSSFSQAFTEIYFPGSKGWHSTASKSEMQKYKEKSPIFFLSNPIMSTIHVHASSGHVPGGPGALLMVGGASMLACSTL